jgi:hypothetical protein
MQMPPLSSEWAIWSLMNGLPALFATVAFLFYPPFQKMFAWDVRDRQSGIFLGTGFLLRTALFVTVITAKSWGEIRWLTWGNAVFAAVLLGVTLVWGDFFEWNRIIAIIWLYLYIEEPVWMLTLVPQAQAAASGVVPGSEILPLTKAVLWVEALVMLAAGTYLFFIDRMRDSAWPWQPDLVSARIMAGFPLAWTAWAVTLALAPTWSEARSGVILNIIWLAAIIASVLVFRSQFDMRRRTVQVYAAVTMVLLLALAGVYFAQG